MSEFIAELIVERMSRTYTWIFEIATDLAEDELAWTPSPTASPIRWQVWHVARWNDRFQASILSQPAQPGPNFEAELWAVEKLAQSWELDPTMLGLFETGAKMDAEASAALAPERRALLDYYARSADAATQAATSVAVERYPEARTTIFPGGSDTTLGSDIVAHLSHITRHLGTIEGLLSAMEVHGDFLRA